MLFASSHQTSPPRRVVVTGAGIITSLGNGWSINAAGFRSGRTTIARSFLMSPRQRVRWRVKLPCPRSAHREFPAASAR